MTAAPIAVLPRFYCLRQLARLYHATPQPARASASSHAGFQVDITPSLLIQPSVFLLKMAGRRLADFGP